MKKKKKKDKKLEYIQIRMSEDMKVQLLSIAEEFGVTASELLRQHIATLADIDPGARELLRAICDTFNISPIDAIGYVVHNCAARLAVSHELDRSASLDMMIMHNKDGSVLTGPGAYDLIKDEYRRRHGVEVEAPEPTTITDFSYVAIGDVGRRPGESNESFQRRKEEMKKEMEDWRKAIEAEEREYRARDESDSQENKKEG